MQSREALERIARYVMPDIPEKKADLALVFGTRHGVACFCMSIHALWQRRMFKRILITGGRTAGQTEPEAHVIARRLISLGIPEDILLLEVEAMNTGENVRFSRDMMASMPDADSINSLLVVGKICALRRYMMTLERHWPAPTRYASPINYFGLEKERWYEHAEFRRRVLAEFEKIPGYLRADYLREISVRDDDTGTEG